MVVTLPGSPQDATENLNIKQVHFKFSNFGHYEEWDFLQICTVHSDYWFKEK